MGLATFSRRPAWPVAAVVVLLVALAIAGGLTVRGVNDVERGDSSADQARGVLMLAETAERSSDESLAKALAGGDGSDDMAGGSAEMPDSSARVSRLFSLRRIGLGPAATAAMAGEAAADEPNASPEGASSADAPADGLGGSAESAGGDAASDEPASRSAQRTFNGRPIEPVRTMTMEVTAYSPDARSCGQWADGQTASGYSVLTNGMNLVAADTELLPFGSIVTVPGYDNGEPVPVLDRGGAIKGKRLDVLFATHERALQWGRRTVEVTVWRYADGEGPEATFR